MVAGGSCREVRKFGGFWGLSYLHASSFNAMWYVPNGAQLNYILQKCIPLGPPMPLANLATEQVTNKQTATATTRGKINRHTTTHEGHKLRSEAKTLDYITRKKEKSGVFSLRLLLPLLLAKFTYILQNKYYILVVLVGFCRSNSFCRPQSRSFDLFIMNINDYFVPGKSTFSYRCRFDVFLHLSSHKVIIHLWKKNSSRVIPRERESSMRQ